MASTRNETTQSILKLLAEVNKEHKVEFTTNQEDALDKLIKQANEKEKKSVGTQTDDVMPKRKKKLVHFPIIKLDTIIEAQPEIDTPRPKV